MKEDRKWAISISQPLIIFILQDLNFVLALEILTPGSRLPDWIRYQSSGKEVIAELPPNWFNSNFLGFGFANVVPKFSNLGLSRFVYCYLSLSRSSDFTHGFRVVPYPHFLCLNREMLTLDHVYLLYVPLSSFSDWCPWGHIINWHQVTHIKASFQPRSDQFGEVKRYGIGLAYSNEDVNHNNPPMIQFGSISSASSPPPNKSTVVLTEIHDEEPSGSVDGSELDNSGYYTADEGEPAETACSKDPSESEMQPQKRLKCSHFQDIPWRGGTGQENAWYAPKSSHNISWWVVRYSRMKNFAENIRRTNKITEKDSHFWFIFCNSNIYRCWEQITLAVPILVCWNWKLFLQCTDSDLLEIIMAEFWDKIVFSSKRI